MEDVADYPHLQRREGTFYHCVRVPADIAASYGKQFERRSLRTKDKREAAAKLASADARVQQLFDEHRRALACGSEPVAGSPALSSAAAPETIRPVEAAEPPRPLDIAALARRHAHDVADGEFAFRAGRYAELQRLIERDDSVEALFRGEILALPRSDWLDTVLCDGEIDTDTALAAVHRVRLQQRLAELRRALTICNFEAVAATVDAEAPAADEKDRQRLARALMAAEIEALQAILDDAGHIDLPAAAAEDGRPDDARSRGGATRAARDGALAPSMSVKDGKAAGAAVNVGIDASVHEHPGAPLLSAVVRAWLAEKARTNAWTEKTRHEREAAVRAFMEVCGDRLAGSYRKADARAFKDVLFAIPPNAHKMRAYAGLSLPAIAAKAKAEGAPQPSAKNVGLKMDAVSSLFLWAKSNYDEVTSNPFEGVKPRVETAPRDERDPFTTAELQAIFAMPPFTGALSKTHWLQRGETILRSSGKFWVPLIALFTGARLMEIVQLRKGDMREEGGITFFDLNEEGDGKRLKTRTSRRRIPVHPAILAAGLMEHVAAVKRDEDRLFPDIAIGSDKNPSGPASKLFARLFEAAGVKRGKTCFHSFRHTFEDACRAGRVDAGVMNALQGHAERGQAGRYGSGHQLERLSEELDKVAYPGLRVPGATTGDESGAAG